MTVHLSVHVNKRFHLFEDNVFLMIVNTFLFDQLLWDLQSNINHQTHILESIIPATPSVHSLRRNVVFAITTMSLRQQLKLPRYGLFYFESDQTLSILPMSKVKTVLEGDHKRSGSVVELLYGSLLLKAEIIGVDGKFQHFVFTLT